MENKLTVNMIRRCERELRAGAREIGAQLERWWVLQKIVVDDLRIREICREHQQDYRARHAASIASEIEAFERWRDTPDPEDIRIQTKIKTLLANG